MFLRYEYWHSVVIGLVDTYTLQAADRGVILITLLLGAHGGKQCRLCSPHFQSASSSPDHPLWPAPATPLGHPPATYTLKLLHDKAQAAITSNVLQLGPDLISIEIECDGVILPSPSREDFRRTYVSF